MDIKKMTVIILILISGIFYYHLTSPDYEEREVFVIRAIDGDTLDTEIGKVRLLGINTPEEKMPYYNEAKFYMEKFENKTLELEIHGSDKYNRFLIYAFYSNNLINSEILRKGLANLYVYDKDEHYPELKKAESQARKMEIGIWKKSKNFGCLTVEKFQPIDKNENENETLILKNICSIELKITIKDDANHIYKEEISANSLLEKTFHNIFNDDGDTLFIWDDSGLLVFERY